MSKWERTEFDLVFSLDLLTLRKITPALLHYSVAVMLWWLWGFSVWNSDGIFNNPHGIPPIDRCSACTVYCSSLSSSLAMFSCGIIVLSKYVGKPVGQTRPDQKSFCHYIQYKHNHISAEFSHGWYSHEGLNFSSSELVWSYDNIQVVCLKFVLMKCSN